MELMEVIAGPFHRSRSPRPGESRWSSAGVLVPLGSNTRPVAMGGDGAQRRGLPKRITFPSGSVMEPSRLP
jgi:hypothetical protein